MQSLTIRDQWAVETLARHVAVMVTVEDEARARSNPVDACAGWLAVHRQSLRYQHYVAPWISRGRFEGASPVLAKHWSTLGEHRARAEQELARFDASTRHQACQRLGLRVAVIGKGGVGKTVLASTLARVLARRGRRVLAADLDTNPGMAISLGLGPINAGLPPEAIEEHAGAGYGWQLAQGVSPGNAVERFSTPGPDGVRYLGVGKIIGPDKLTSKQSVAAIVQILLGFGSPDWDVVADLEAGPTTPFESYHAFATDVMVVVGPAWRSAMTARRLLPMVADADAKIIANLCRGEADHPGLTPWARIPFDGAVAEAERQGRSPLDVCPDAPAMRAIGALAERLVRDRRQPPGA